VIRLGDWFPPGSADLDRWGIALPLAAAIRSLGLPTHDFRPYSFATLSEQAGSGSAVALRAGIRMTCSKKIRPDTGLSSIWVSENSACKMEMSYR
jgi:hypothetical protein